MAKRHGVPTLVLAAAMVAAAAAGGAALPARAQLLGGPLGGPVGGPLNGPLGGLPSLPNPPLSGVPGAPGALGRTVAGQTLGTTSGLAGRLLEARQLRLRALIRRERTVLEAGPHGWPVVKGEILLLSPSPASLAIAERAGFAVRERTALAPLGLEVAALEAPAGLSAVAALARLKRLDPTGHYDLDPIYQPAGVPPSHAQRRGESAARSSSSSRARPPIGVPIGLIDTGVQASHPAFAGERLEERGFAGEVVPAAHGTAVASLLVGRQGRFEGAAPGAPLLVADVYGSSPTGGSALDLARALAWLAERGVRVVNMSLAGPPDIALGAAVAALVRRGEAVIAPVGDDGPAAPPAFPASWPGVVSVTAVDGKGRLLIEDGRARHVDFAGPGADMAAAKIGGGYGSVRGSSFAVPIVAGLLARTMDRPGESLPAALDALARSARHGRGLGRGLVGADLRVPPFVLGVH
ncbi:MAG: S8 family serine peptidase [Caulobacteraceae bacterium]